MTGEAGQSFGAAVYYGRSEAGHRRSYMETMEREAGMHRVGLARAFLAREPVLFLMIEERPLAYAAACLLRAALGRRTAGLLLQPGATLRRDTLRRRAKHLGLRLLRRVPACRTLAIEPFGEGDGAAAICDGWIYDPQLWDLPDGEAPAAGVGPAEEALGRLGGRKLVAALGRQTRDKGFDVFARLYAEDARVRERYLFAYGGEVEPGLEAERAAFEAAGGVGAARRITDAELFALYAAADLVWCRYAPGYDQASGVFGRAVQLGVPAAVRRGSRLHRLCEAEEIPHVALDGEGLPPPEALPRRIPPPLEATRARRRRSVETLRRALGFGG